MGKRKNIATLLLMIIALLLPINPINAKITNISRTTVQSKSNVGVKKLLSQTTNSTVSQTTYAKQKKVFMWEVTSKSSKNKNKKIYLLGSIHVGKANMYPLDKKIEDAFNNSKNLVVEVDITKLDQNAVSSYLLKYGMQSSNKTLKSTVPKDLYKKLTDKYKQYGVDINLYSSFQPWVPYMELTQTMYTQIGYNSQKGIDLYFLDKAKSGKKKILELESADLQYKMFGNFSQKLQINLLESCFEKNAINSVKTEVDKMFEYWKNGDAEGIEKCTFSEINNNEMKEFYNKMFYQRNVGMVNKIESYFKDNNTYMVIAGAGHMVGKKGIVELLKAKGYIVKQQ